MSQSIILVHFEMNKKEIALKFCENKDKPQLHCCGKCMLKKKLAAQEEQQKSPAFLDLKTDIQLYYSEAFISINFKDSYQAKLIPSSSVLYSIIETEGIFHPPTC